MKKFFEEPIVEVLAFNVEDVVTTSDPLLEPEQGENDGPVL